MLVRATLNSAESRVLGLLVRKLGEVITRRELTDHAWNTRVVADGSLSQAVFNLRTYLHNTIHRNMIQTVPRRGYSFDEKYIASASTAMNQDVLIPAIGGCEERIPAEQESTVKFITSKILLS